MLRGSNAQFGIFKLFMGIFPLFGIRLLCQWPDVSAKLVECFPCGHVLEEVGDSFKIGAESDKQIPRYPLSRGRMLLCFPLSRCQFECVAIKLLADLTKVVVESANQRGRIAVTFISAALNNPQTTNNHENYMFSSQPCIKLKKT